MASFLLGSVPLAVSQASGIPSPSESTRALPFHTVHVLGAPYTKVSSLDISSPFFPKLITSSII